MAYNPPTMRPSARFFPSLAATATLLAALLVPLYFVVFTERVFEAERAALTRALGAVALLAGLAWLWLVRPRRSALVAVARQPLVLLAVAVVLVETMATATSVAPWRSLLGAYTRGQGLATTVALAALAAGAALLTRRPGGDWRLAYLLGAAAFPAALYGLLQRWGLDPLPWLGDNVVRVSGPAGNSVLLGAWLAMVLPFAAVATWQAWRQAATAPNYATTLRLAAWLITTVAGLAALVLSGSRGPLLGLAVGALAAGLALATQHGLRRVAVALLAAAGGLALGVLALNAAGELPPPLGSLPMVERLATALDPESSTIRVRRLLWSGSAEAVVRRPERLLLGSGPETMELVWAPYYPPILAYEEPRGQVPDRAHNLVWDTLLTTGALGLLALWAFLAALLDAALAGLGLLPDRAARRWLWLLLAGGTLAGAALAGVAGGFSLAGPGAGLGAVVGIVAWLGWRALVVPADQTGTATRTSPVSTSSATTEASRDSSPQAPSTAASVAISHSSPQVLSTAAFSPSAVTSPLHLAALAAVTAHLAETQLGFAVMATRLVLWLVAGALVGLASRGAAAGDEAGGHEVTGGNEAPAREPVTRDGVFAALAVGVLLAFELARTALVGSGMWGAAGLLGAAVLVVGLAVGRPGRWDRRAVAAVAGGVAVYTAGHVLIAAWGTGFADDSVPVAAGPAYLARAGALGAPDLLGAARLWCLAAPRCLVAPRCRCPTAGLGADDGDGWRDGAARRGAGRVAAGGAGGSGRGLQGRASGLAAAGAAGPRRGRVGQGAVVPGPGPGPLRAGGAPGTLGAHLRDGRGSRGRGAGRPAGRGGGAGHGRGQLAGRR